MLIFNITAFRQRCCPTPIQSIIPRPGGYEKVLIKKLNKEVKKNEDITFEVNSEIRQAHRAGR